MFAGYQKMFRATAVVLICCLVNVYVFSNIAGSVVLAQTPASQEVTGVLDISGAKYILLNGNRTPRGATVLTGAQLDTEDAKGAMVNFGSIGKVEIGCRSVVKIIFGANQVEVTVINGFARLTTNQGITGTIITSDKNSLKTDSSLLTSTVETAAENSCGPLVFGAPVAGGLFGLSGLPTWLGVGAIAAATTAAALVAGGGPPCDRLPPQAVSRVRPCN